MVTDKLSDLEIKVRIVPRRLRFPERGTSVAWAKAHDCVDALQDLIRNADRDCLQAEQSKELSAGAIRRRRAEICDQTMVTLQDFKPFQIAEKAITENIVALKRLDERNPEQAQMDQHLTKALAELREGLEATRRAVAARCKMREAVRV